jgi:hypothetical protein
MSKHLCCLVLLAIGSIQAFSQAAGNTIYAAPAPAAAEDYSGSYDQAAKSRARTYQPVYNYVYANPEANAVILNDSVIELSVKALMNEEANSYVAVFGVSQIAASLDSCNQLMNERINGFISRLTALGISRNDIYVDFISQVPVFEYEVEKKLFSKKYNEIPKGFELKKNVHVGYKKATVLDEMLLAAAKNEIYDVVKVDDIIDNVEAIYDSLRSVSIKYLNRKTEDMKKLGIRFNAKFDVVAEDSHCTYPLERYKSYTAFNNSSMPALKKSSSSSNVYNAPKTLSLYYDKVPYSNFEIVINPRMIEPCAQFSYNLRIRYTFKTEVMPREKPAVVPAGIK